MGSASLPGMPCPYFEPQTIVRDAQHPRARLPLLDEYDGLCRAQAIPLHAPTELRFAYCNQGYSRGYCGRFPADDGRSGLRYTITSRNAATLEILWIEEQEFVPLRWHSVRYLPASSQFDPEPSNECMRAQLLAFCRSYLRRFPEGEAK